MEHSDSTVRRACESLDDIERELQSLGNLELARAVTHVTNMLRGAIGSESGPTVPDLTAAIDAMHVQDGKTATAGDAEPLANLAGRLSSLGAETPSDEADD